MAETLDFLPSEIKTEIFSQLPVYSIIRCKRVCKTWRAVIDELLNNPSFVDTHTRRFLSSSSSPSPAAAPSFTSFLAREKNSKPGNNQFHIVGSCNGLVCLVKNYNNAYICNPVTKEYVNLSAPLKKNVLIIAVGFGYVPDTNEYKFVRIAFDRIRKIYVSVYTLGSGTWSIREFEDDSYHDQLRYVTVATTAGILFNGVLYWSSPPLYGNIITFDLTTEKLILVPSPIQQPISYEMCMLGGNFCVIRTHGREVREQEIRVINKTTWKKLIRIKSEIEKDFAPTFAQEEKILLSYDYMKFVSYDPKTSSDSQIVDWIEILLPYMSKFEMIPYMMSLVSLRELGENASVVAS